MGRRNAVGSPLETAFRQSAFAGGPIQIVTPEPQRIPEKVLTGFDAEIGWRALLVDVEQGQIRKPERFLVRQGSLT